MRLALRRNGIISVTKIGICLNLGPPEGDAKREREVIGLQAQREKEQAH